VKYALNLWKTNVQYVEQMEHLEKYLNDNDDIWVEIFLIKFKS
jgi:hypothetical protein